MWAAGIAWGAWNEQGRGTTTAAFEKAYQGHEPARWDFHDASDRLTRYLRDHRLIIALTRLREHGLRLLLRFTSVGPEIAQALHREHFIFHDLRFGTSTENGSTSTPLAADGVTLLTPDTTRTVANLGRERALASTRLVIESVFANPKGQMRLEQHLTKTPAGLCVRIAQRILTLTLGVLLNTGNGCPARALAAYDGR
jgi:hypothetical protein